MSKTEQTIPSLEQTISSAEQRQQVQKYVYSKIRGGDGNGMSQEEYDKVKNLLVAPGWRVSDLIELSTGMVIVNGWVKKEKED